MKKATHIILALMAVLFGFLLSACEAIEEPLPTTRAEWRQLLKWDDACESGISSAARASKRFTGVESYAWSENSLLVSVVCKTGTSNQGEIVYLLTNTNKSRQITLLEFPQYHYREPESAPRWHYDPNAVIPSDQVDLFYTYTDRLLWGNLLIDPEKQTITNNDFFTGASSTCGLHTVYRLVEGKPQVIEFSAQPHCIVKAPPIDNWKAYPASVRAKWPSGPVPK